MYWLVTVTHYAYTHSRHDALPFSLALRGLPLRRRSPTLDPAFGPHDRRDVGRVPDLPDAPGTGLLGDVHRGTLQALWCGDVGQCVLLGVRRDAGTRAGVVGAAGRHGLWAGPLVAACTLEQILTLRADHTVRGVAPCAYPPVRLRLTVVTPPRTFALEAARAAGFGSVVPGADDAVTVRFDDHGANLPASTIRPPGRPGADGMRQPQSPLVPTRAFGSRCSHRGTTPCASTPFLPRCVSNETRCPSSSDRYPLISIWLSCTKTSAPPPSC